MAADPLGVAREVITERILAAEEAGTIDSDLTQRISRWYDAECAQASGNKDAAVRLIRATRALIEGDSPAGTASEVAVGARGFNLDEIRGIFAQRGADESLPVAA